MVEHNPRIFDEARVLLIGGEAVLPKTVNVVRKNSPHVEIVNVYGPTENSDLSSCHIIQKDYEKSVPIGMPVSNSTCYILDKNQNLLPIGIPGEIYVGGDGVALGYLNNKELTEEKFIPNKFGEGKLYKTGDLGYWEKEGIIQFVSRMDDQVKIRGFRIELKEIETKVLEFGNIKECAVVIAQNGSAKILVACIGTKNEIDTKQLNKFLKENLPFYMIPSKYLCMENLPLNINGKLDTKLLLQKISEMPEEITPPKNETEKALVEIWKEVLELKEIGTNQNFFEIGGDSLSAIKLLNLINLKFEIQITIKALFDMPTIEELALHIYNNNTEKIFDEEKKDNSNLIKDYSKIDELLSKNTLSNFVKPKQESVGNLLLLGATGFLGAHILSNYIDNEKGDIYCIVRPKKGKKPKDRLLERLNFYFGNKYDQFIDRRIKIISGDIILKNFGLNMEDYEFLGKNVDTVINSAAIVKHYGKKQVFEDINVKGTNNIISFCENYNKKLLHCSTLSLTRDLSKEINNIRDLPQFSESTFYFNQNLNNLYINSKFNAEELVYEARLRGLSACCLRIGNISNRYSDGMFQKNIEENAILSKLKSFMEIGYVPDYLLNVQFDFTQVDICSQAILKIANTDINYSTFHIVNNNIKQMKELINIFKKLSVEIEAIPEKEFMEIFERIRQDKNRRDILVGIIQDWIRDKSFKYYYNVVFNSDFTNKYLESIGFYWPDTDEEYFEKYIGYLKNIGYIGG
ncbi:MAG: SDR family oxidoreductase [Clostridia bacterium]|nr:SDR family oxidoreductase [Clostridia bacterium]